MSTVVGGIRARLIYQSLSLMLQDALSALGWLGASPIIIYVDEPLDENEPIAINTVALSADTSDSVEAELGSNLEDDTWTFYLDFYASKEALGQHVISDLRDVLRGKMPSIGRSDSTIVVYDWRQATPPALFTATIENVIKERVRDGIRPWHKHWHLLRFDVVDTYGDEDDS